MSAAENINSRGVDEAEVPERARRQRMNTGPAPDVVTVHATLPAKVVELWAGGFSTQEIADALNVSEAGVCRILTARPRQLPGEGAAE